MEVWFNPSCTKCRIAKEMLDEAEADYVVRRYLDDPPSEAEIDEVLDKLGMQPWEITRMGEQVAQDLDLVNKPKERAAWIRVLAENPGLIQRPIIVTSDGGAWIGRDPDSVKDAIMQEAPSNPKE